MSNCTLVLIRQTFMGISTDSRILHSEFKTRLHLFVFVFVVVI